jgi:hypothetical protein
MSTNYNDMEHHNATQAHGAITASVSTIGTGDMEMENAALTGTPGQRLERFVSVYGSIKPLLTALSTLVILPPKWRVGLIVFIRTIESVVAIAPQLDPGIVKIDDPKPVPDFKAGKDI